MPASWFFFRFIVDYYKWWGFSFLSPLPSTHTLNLSHDPVYCSSPSCLCIVYFVRPVFSITCWQALEPVMEDSVQMFAWHCPFITWYFFSWAWYPCFLPSPINSSPLPPIILSELQRGGCLFAWNGEENLGIILNRL